MSNNVFFVIFLERKTTILQQKDENILEKISLLWLRPCKSYFDKN